MRRLILIQDGKLVAASETTSSQDAVRALAVLRRFKHDSVAISVLRSLLTEYAGAQTARRLTTDQVLGQIARLVAERRIGLVELYGSRRSAIAAEPEEGATEKAAAQAPRASSRTWIEFQVVDHATGQPIPMVLLTVTLPSGVTEDHTTDSNGLVHIADISPGECEVTCSLHELGLEQALNFVAMGESKASPSAAPGAGREAINRRIAIVKEHRVKTGESLAGLAQQAGLKWQALAKFNWGTDVPKEVNKHLRDDVGCTKKTRDGRNYSFDSADEPGIIYIPSKWQESRLASSKRHTIRVSYLDRFSLVLENEKGLRIPEAAFEITLADGSVRKGTLGKSGMAVLKDLPPGAFSIAYPDSDDVLAKSLAASARKAFDERDPQEVYRLLEHAPQVIQGAIQAYDKYFNDYTGNGLVEDIYQEITDPDALTAVVGMLARAKVQTHEKTQFIEWQPDEVE